MNILDIPAHLIPKHVPFEHDRLDMIFARQRELMEKYHGIEESNGRLQTPNVPVVIDSGDGQARLKDFAWRVTEELTEATDALDRHSQLREHAQEEIADAYHFLVELLILSGYSADDVYVYSHRHIVKDTAVAPSCKLEILQKAIKREFRALHPWEPAFINHGAYQVVQYVGNAMNCLKNKPWKQSHMITDQKQYENHIMWAHAHFLHLASAVELDFQELFIMYFLKSEVNKFRQESNY